MAKKIDYLTKEQLQELADNASTYAELAELIGYKGVSGETFQIIKKRLIEDHIDISHFRTTPVKRDEDNIFVENSTASQTTLRRWYLKGGYTEYVCSICGMQPFWQGKELTLILDHISGNNKDDRLENLRWVCPNCNQQLETTGYKKMRTENKEKVTHTCPDCGGPMSSGAERCKACADKRLIRLNKELDRETLKTKIRTTSFLQIGKEYGVTDNAIRKWCIKFGLPSKKTEINKMSNEEWDKV